MMGKRSTRQTRRLMERMGLKVEEMENVEQVTIKTSTREITIDRPSVTLTRMQDQTIYQIMGGEVSETKIAANEAEIREEDVSLVAQQANVSMETARIALTEARGNLAKAIILLAQRDGN